MPVRRCRGLAEKRFVVGETYTLAGYDPRSIASHNHYFAALADGHRNLPEHLGDQFPTSEHLRAWCLIREGYRHDRALVCTTGAEAIRVAAFLRPANPFSVVAVRGKTVIEYTAQSQSRAAMGNEIFQSSKTAVLARIAEMIGVTAEQMSQSAGNAA